MKHTLRYFFGRLLDNHQKLRDQRMVRLICEMTHKSRVLHFWRRLFKQRMAEKLKVAKSMMGIYKVQKYRLFRIWKVKTTCGYHLNRIELRAYAWKKWRALLAARRHCRAYRKRAVFAAWKTYLFSIDLKLRLQLRLRARLLRVVTRYACSLLCLIVLCLTK